MEQAKKYVHRVNVPYKTKTGIQIGLAYQAPAHPLTYEGEFIQAVLLGDKHSVFPGRHTILMGLYMAAMVGMITFGVVMFS